jgi:hypothetical protein
MENERLKTNTMDDTDLNNLKLARSVVNNEFINRINTAHLTQNSNVRIGNIMTDSCSYDNNSGASNSQHSDDSSSSWNSESIDNKQEIITNLDNDISRLSSPSESGEYAELGKSAYDKAYNSILSDKYPYTIHTNNAYDESHPASPLFSPQEYKAHNTRKQSPMVSVSNGSNNSQHTSLSDLFSRISKNHNMQNESYITQNATSNKNVELLNKSTNTHKQTCDNCDNCDNCDTCDNCDMLITELLNLHDSANLSNEIKYGQKMCADSIEILQLENYQLYTILMYVDKLYISDLVNLNTVSLSRLELVTLHHYVDNRNRLFDMLNKEYDQSRAYNIFDSACECILEISAILEMLTFE